MHPTDVQSPIAVRSIPLDRLEVSPANVRKTDAGLQAFAELKASIAAHGILSNLVVRAFEAPGRFSVIAGARRFAALIDLADDGQIAPDMPVPCRVLAIDAAETEISLAENVVRAAMHPADQVEAFAALAESGATVSAIAARFGVAERTVEQRLRLGNAAPELLQAYRDDEIDLESLRAFSITTDHARQTAAWKQVSEQGYRPNAWQIKRMLTEDRVPAAAAIAQFVGIQAYEAAGGHIDRDLFSRDDDTGAWFENPALLDKLATQRLQETADELAKSWKWAEPRLDADWTTFASFARVHAIPAEPTPEETAERQKLGARHDEIATLDEDEFTEEHNIEAEAIEERLGEIEDQIGSRSTYAPDDMTIAGCIVTIGNNGEPQIVSGLVRPDDIPPSAPSPDTKSGDTENTAAATEPARSRVEQPAMTLPAASTDPAAAARKHAGIGLGLADDLRSIRTAVVKVELCDDFEAAFDLFVFQAARSVFVNGYVPTALEISTRETADRPRLRINDQEFGAENPGEELLADRSSLRLDWTQNDDDGEAFAAFVALPTKDKKKLFAASVARTVKPQLSFEHEARPELEATVARLDIDFAAKLRPTANMFWSRINKAQTLDIARATLGIEWAAGHSKDKKPVLADAMERAFGAADEVPAGVTPESRSAALAWVPPGFAAFDTGPSDTTSVRTQPDQPSDATTGIDQPNHTATEPATQNGPVSRPQPPDCAHDPAHETVPANPRIIIDGEPVKAPEQQVQAEDPEPATCTATSNGHDLPPDAFEIPEFLRRT